MFKQGPVSSSDSCPLGVKKLGVGMMKGKAVASAREKLSKAAEDSPAGVSPSQAPSYRAGGGGQQWDVAHSPSPWAPRPFHCCPETGLVVTASFTVNK